MPIGGTIGLVSKPAGPQRGPAGVAIAKQYAAELKLALPQAPVGARGEALALTLPSNISQSSSDELGDLYARFSALATYAEAQASLVDVERTDAEDAQKKLEAKLLLQEEGTATERKAAVALDPQVMAFSEEYRIANAKYILLQALFNGYDRSRATISREFSRRGLDVRG